MLAEATVSVPEPVADLPTRGSVRKGQHWMQSEGGRWRQRPFDGTDTDEDGPSPVDRPLSPPRRWRNRIILWM